MLPYFCTQNLRKPCEGVIGLWRCSWWMAEWLLGGSWSPALLPSPGILSEDNDCPSAPLSYVRQIRYGRFHRIWQIEQRSTTTCNFLYVPRFQGTYHDQTAFMMIPEESLAELNNHLKNSVSMRNFRPSIVIKGTPEPFSEDVWTYVRIGADGGPIFKTAKPCTRCVILILMIKWASSTFIA